ncbi:MAG: energy transducer TonB [bacterium]
MKHALLFIPLIFILTCAIVASAQESSGKSVADSIRQKKTTKKAKVNVRQMLLFEPTQIQMLRRAYQRWQRVIQDTSDSKKIEQSRQVFFQILHLHDRGFVTKLSRIRLHSSIVEETLQYYDDDVQMNLRWYLHFLDSEKWAEIYRSFDRNFLEQKLWNDRITNTQDLRDAQLRFFNVLLNQAEKIPPKFRRKHSSRFIRYDEPPSPIGGFAALQKKLPFAGHGDRAIPQSVILLKAFIAEDGEVLQIKIQHSSGSSQLDSAAVAAVKSTAWQPAKYKGEPIKIDVLLPLRVGKPLVSPIPNDEK